MSSMETLKQRNSEFAATFSEGDLPMMPKLRTLLVACVDARVDPAHVLKLDLGDAGVIRNSGGRVTRAVIEEIASLAFLAGQMTGADPDLNVVLMQHTQCGVERFADPAFREGLKARTGIDVSEVAIHDHGDALIEDLKRLRDADALPGTLVISAMLYDTATGKAREVMAPKELSQMRDEAA